MSRISFILILIRCPSEEEFFSLFRLNQRFSVKQTWLKNTPTSMLESREEEMKEDPLLFLVHDFILFFSNLFDEIIQQSQTE